MKLSNKKKKQIRVLVDQAARALGNGRDAICEQLCAEIEVLQADNPYVANFRGIICRNAGQRDHAFELFRQAVAASPGSGEFHANLASLYLEREQYREALESYRRAIRHGIRELSVLRNYSKALIEMGLHEEAEPVLQRLRKQQPSDIDILMRLYRICYESERYEEAESCLREIIDIEPTDTEAHLRLAQLMVQMGRMEEGETEFRRTLELDPARSQAISSIAQIKKFRSEDDEDIATAISMYERSAPDSEERISLGFAIGKMMHDLGDYDRAFQYYRGGNDVRYRGGTYHRESELAHIESIMEMYTPEVLSRTGGLHDATPIFVVGMPRCGSTLTEQILASHPDVSSKGECHLFEGEVLSSMHEEDAPLTLERITSFFPEQWREIGQAYLKGLRSGVPEHVRRITDKSLNNIRFVGAIHCALPQARIVHVRRHPLDTCLSIYRQNIQGQAFDFGRDLEELGYYYQMYLKLMQHWRDMLPKGVMYELTYERLIADQEGETRKLLDACGLEWSDQCLQFQQARNAVRTASVAQVRRAIYTDSMAVWKRYEKHLAPLIRILGTDYAP
ncbi:MAG TPA: sulfotransferase [Mariprofundaceae bacterium]|nr:sulfotransferase [Mariprofundaceae bacterium]